MMIGFAMLAQRNLAMVSHRSNLGHIFYESNFCETEPTKCKVQKARFLKATTKEIAQGISRFVLYTKCSFQMLDVFIPRDNDGNYNKCHMFNGTVSSNVTNSSSQIVVCQHGWKYDIDNGRTTFVTEVDA